MSAGAGIFVAALVVLCVGWLLRLVRRGHLRGKYALPWLFASPVIVILALSGSLLDWVAKQVGTDAPATAFLLLCIGLLALMAVHFAWELSRLEERTRRLAEEAALLRERIEREERD